jgi:hypothetical protein
MKPPTKAERRRAFLRVLEAKHREGRGDACLAKALSLASGEHMPRATWRPWSGWRSTNWQAHHYPRRSPR